MTDREFNAAMSRFLAEGGKDMEIIPERCVLLNEIFQEVFALMGKCPEMKMNPTFATGDVVIDVPYFEVDGDEVLKLKSILAKSDSFEIMPLTNGDLSFCFTLGHVFRKKN